MNIEKIKNRYLAYCEFSPVNDREIASIEAILNITLPLSFKMISKFHSGDALGGIEHYEICRKSVSTNIVKETLRLRDVINLSTDYIVIAEPPESLIVLNVNEGSAYPEVIWIDAVEVDNLDNYDSLSTPTTWSTYDDFFCFLLDEEDEEQQYS